MSLSTRIIARSYWVILIAGLCCLAIFLGAQAMSQANHSVARISFLNVGQGDSIFIRLPDETTILIDAGPDYSSLYQLGPLMPWWKHRIDYVVITHGDKDHYFGIFGILEKYTIGTVLYNGSSSTDALYNSLLSEIKKKNIPLIAVAQGQAIHWPWGGEFSVMWPEVGYGAPTDNQKSVVTEFQWNDISFLFMGDVAQEEERLIMRDNPGLHALVLKAGHHGSNGSSASDFLLQVHAQWCIISAGFNNVYHHPHPEAVGRMKAAQCQIVSTIDHDTITFLTDGRKILLLKK